MVPSQPVVRWKQVNKLSYEITTQTGLCQSSAWLCALGLSACAVAIYAFRLATCVKRFIACQQLPSEWLQLLLHTVYACLIGTMHNNPEATEFFFRPWSVLSHAQVYDTQERISCVFRGEGACPHMAIHTSLIIIIIVYSFVICLPCIWHVTNWRRSV